MLLADEKNIREVTMFPMNQNAQDLMMNAPSEVSENQLKELNLLLKKKKITYFFPFKLILISDKSTRFFYNYFLQNLYLLIFNNFQKLILTLADLCHRYYWTFLNFL